MTVNTAESIGQIQGDRRRVEQILLNLLNNAIKFTDKGSVSLSVQAVSAYMNRKSMPEKGTLSAIKFTVTDTGIGIVPEELQKLFQPFHQVDTGLARKNEGTGLGLAISRRLAELMGGEVMAASEPGKGSVFTFILPV
jgi:signal transduction histidine kinase